MNPYDALNGGASLKQIMRSIEKQILIRVLETMNYNLTQTAWKLQITRQGLVKKMDLLEIGNPKAQSPSTEN
jgi:transcriptional regulator with PAS, ATPase and Fis domain